VRFLAREVFLAVLDIAATLALIGTVPAQDLRLTDDASVSSGSPRINNGNSSTMVSRGAPAVQRAFLKFDLSTLPARTTQVRWRRPY
jgi:hypothetical protein